MINLVRISVITTVRNGGKYLFETLKSVSAQTYKPIEHIIVDDGSSDDTISIIESFKRLNNSQHISLIKTNGIGRGNALNLGISKANGNWIAIIDADDLWHPEKLKIQVEVINNTNVAVLGTKSRLFHNSKSIKFENEITRHWEQIGKILLKSNKLSHSSILIKKELCNYDSDRISQFDFELWLRLFSEGYLLYCCTDYLCYHRIHINQSFESKMGKSYSWRSFKLKFYYSFKNKDIVAMGYNITKLIFDMIIPRKIKLGLKR